MNRKFQSLTLNELLEKLSDNTLEYSKMHVMGAYENEFRRVRRDILELQQEIVRRKEEEDDRFDFDRPSIDERRTANE